MRVQPDKSIAEPVLLYSSIHSSKAEARVPAHATSLIRTANGGKEGTAVGVAVGVGVMVLVGVGVS